MFKVVLTKDATDMMYEIVIFQNVFFEILRSQIQKREKSLLRASSMLNL